MNALVLVLALSLEAVVADAERGGADGVLLVRRGDTVLYQRAFGSASIRERFDIGSISKMVTAVAVLRELPLELTVGEVFPDAPPDKAAITVEQLLRHRSGLTDSVGLDETYVKRAFFLEKLWKTPLEKPGYSNAGYSLLAAMLEVRTGKSYDALLPKSISYARREPLAQGTLREIAWGSTGHHAEVQARDGEPLITIRRENVVLTAKRVDDRYDVRTRVFAATMPLWVAIFAFVVSAMLLYGRPMNFNHGLAIALIIAGLGWANGMRTRRNALDRSRAAIAAFARRVTTTR
jgi:Beta-lactamase